VTEIELGPLSFADTRRLLYGPDQMASDESFMTGWPHYRRLRATC
jgi:hypothetical protein